MCSCDVSESVSGKTRYTHTHIHTRITKKWKLMLIIFNMPECKISDELRSCNHFHEYSLKMLASFVKKKWQTKKPTLYENNNERTTNNITSARHHCHQIAKRQRQKNAYRIKIKFSIYSNFVFQPKKCTNFRI